MKNTIPLVLAILLTLTMACSKKTEFTANFGNTHDRIWVGKDYWSIPLEDWEVMDGSLHCTGTVPGSRVNLLTYAISPKQGIFAVSVNAGVSEPGSVPGSAGLLIGVHDDEDPDVRAACYFGGGIMAGISLHGYAFLDDQRAILPEGFDFGSVNIAVNGNNRQLSLKVTDASGKSPEELTISIDGIEGLVAIANNLLLPGEQNPGNSLFHFDNLRLSGSKVTSRPENAFGPILFTQYTLSRQTLKLMAFIPPIGEDDNQEVSLQLNKSGRWETVAMETIDPGSRTALFRIENWDDAQDVAYRVEYIETGKDGTTTPDYYTGTIRRDPVERQLKFAGMTCQFTSAFPYTPLIENLVKLNPDILYFSGDQVYEPNGGYQIKREPADIAILNYLGKYYMFGWAFGDLMRDRPVIITPDDHDVYHGNLWGESGIPMPPGRGTSDSPGFRQQVEMVNAVNRTQCGHLPDPYDPTPIQQGMSVWYTSLTYGRVSFAIVSDRVYKTAPEAVSDWDGRHDHLREPLEDMSFLDIPGLEKLGQRQEEFLEDWILDWEGADMKVLLSQTVYANVATHHGGLMDYLFADLDSGGWPKAGRDWVVDLMRKGAVFHINGDQHLSSLVQYGLNDYRDGGWSFCTPAVSNFYTRWFLPDELNIPVRDRPEHGHANTGKFEDSFGNKMVVYAIGNPGRVVQDNTSRYNQAQLRVSGFGMVTFDQTGRTIGIDSWRFLADVENPRPMRDQFPGWPLKISQFDNLGTGAGHLLPEITVNKPGQLMQIWNEKTGELEQVYRIMGNMVQPGLHHAGIYRVIVGEGNEAKTLSGLITREGENIDRMSVEL